MIFDGVSYSAFIQLLCRVILSRMVNPTVVSLQSDLVQPVDPGSSVGTS